MIVDEIAQKNKTHLTAGIVYHDVFLSDFTSWRVGGKVKQFYHPVSIPDLQAFMASLPENEEIIFLGLGSNLLVRDAGLDATIIATQGCLNQLYLIDDLRVYADAGIACGQAARFSARQNLSGIEFLAGIPGTIGGALAMNAGCFGAETWQFVDSVQMIDRAGNLYERTPSMFDIAYRHVVKPCDEWFISAIFKLTQGDKQTSLSRIRQMLDKRAETQPTNEPSCGSVFRNPPGHYAAQLIETSGLKGLALGGAQVSTKHANFIVNTGKATAKDIESLINLVAQKVKETHGIDLIKEVHIVGQA
jgi:UDP-N-acetylmuramate dehydrogenase